VAAAVVGTLHGTLVVEVRHLERGSQAVTRGATAAAAVLPQDPAARFFYNFF
jgi:hypothetical protein